jgi:hypothetical protein
MWTKVVAAGKNPFPATDNGAIAASSCDGGDFQVSGLTAGQTGA